MAKTTCPECGGEGETWEDVWLGDVGGHSTRHYRCEPCDGTGEVEGRDEDEDETAEFERAEAVQP